MKLTRSLVSLSVIFSFAISTFLAFPHRASAENDTKLALERGYRTGYSDGYMAGYRDTIDGLQKKYSRHSEYGNADRAFNKEYGAIDDYRDGYQQGFEIGYDTGFEKRSFDATIPAGLIRRNGDDPEVAASAPEAPAEPSPQPAVVSEPAAELQNAGVSESTTPVQPSAEAETSGVAGSAAEPMTARVSAISDDIIVLPRDTELIVELQNELTTDRAREGDKFTAIVLSPAEVSGAMIEGRVEKVQRPGRIKRRSEMLLSFDRIVVSETRWSNFDAILTEVLPVIGDNVRRVDPEGAAVGKSTVKGDSLKIAAATGTGAGIGAVAGGPVGAAVGAGVGAAVGVSAAVIEHGKHIKLNRSQQLRIRSSYDTQIR